MTCHMLHRLQTRLDYCEARNLNTAAEYIAQQIEEHIDGGYFYDIIAPPCRERRCVTPEEWSTYATRRQDTNTNARPPKRD